MRGLSFVTRPALAALALVAAARPLLALARMSVDVAASGAPLSRAVIAVDGACVLSSQPIPTPGPGQVWVAGIMRF